MTTTEPHVNGHKPDVDVLDITPRPRLDKQPSPADKPILDEPQPVDQAPDPRPTAYDRITAHREASKQPLVEPWLREREERDPILRWALGYSWHTIAFHAVRLPIYQWRLTWRSPVGLVRAVRWGFNTLLDAEGRPLRQSAVSRDEVREYLQLAKERNARVRHRAVGAAVLALPVLALLAYVAFFAGPVVQLVAAVLVVDVLGVIGRPHDRPLVSKATTPAHIAPPLRAEVVEDAIRALTGMKRDAPIEFLDPIYRDGAGWMAKVRLPRGFTVSKVLSQKEELANGLRRATGAVWPEGDEDDASVLKLWVGFQPFHRMKMPPHPLIKPNAAADFFKPIPYGVDKRLNPVKIRLFENNVLLGAIPGAGKSAAVRNLVLGASLDPTVELRLWSLKANDFEALEQVAHTFGWGLTDDVIEACLDDLRAVKADIIRRTKSLAKVGKELAPDGKVTRGLANRRDLGLHPMVMIIDECQNIYQHETYGAEASKLTMDIIRMGRAYGVVLVLATQRPDKDALPKGISANASVRVCLRMSDHHAVDMVLGTGAHGRGLKAELFKDSEKGVGFVLGVTNDDIVARSHYTDAAISEKIGRRAHELRVAEDRLSGYALGVEVEKADEATHGADLLADLVHVADERGVEWLWNTTAVELLGALRPDAYGGLNESSLGQLLAKRHVGTRQLNRKDPLGPADAIRQNLTGFEIADVRAAIEGRNPR